MVVEELQAEIEIDAWLKFVAEGGEPEAETSIEEPQAEEMPLEEPQAVTAGEVAHAELPVEELLAETEVEKPHVEAKPQGVPATGSWPRSRRSLLPGRFPASCL
jgi:hypothetical protein